ncbi:hypothetical protein [Methylocystis sp.]|uniref:hypothetical protein n=1 Tax=Methylocystis sp. TaxID=1911079 RepID=UPI003DA4C36E
MIEREADQIAAMAAATPVLPLIYRILEESVAFYFSDEHYSDAARADHTDSAMANCIYSHAEKKLLAASDESAGVFAINARGMRVLNYRDVALARFKKVKPNGKHSNYPTKQQRDYDDQKTLPGIPDPAFRLTAGYQLDVSGSVLERIMIARPLGRNIFWTAQVTMIDSAVHWEDITPERFVGTGRSDFDADRARRRRGGE